MPLHLRTSLLPLAALYAVLVIYASLYPFSNWRLPTGSSWAFITLPWPRWWTGFDLVANLLGYVPLGMLLCGALLRSGWRRLSSVAMTVFGGALLSGALETLQSFLPVRIPSNVDWGLNALGTLVGALVAAAVHARGWMGRWQSFRDRWFLPHSAGGLALLLAWPVGLLFPPPLPLGLGQMLARLQDSVAAMLQGTAFAGWVGPAPDRALDPLAPGTELVTIALGLLAPCLLAFSISPVGWRRLGLVAGALAFGVGTTTLSTTLNFGPQNALAWMTQVSQLGLAVGAIAALVLAIVPPRAAAALGLVFVTLLVVLVNQAPFDPYTALSLKSWEQGRFIRFHGIAQWVGWLWPFAVLALLLPRVAARELPPQPAAPAPAAPPVPAAPPTLAAPPAPAAAVTAALDPAPAPVGEARPRIDAMSYYERHIFFCLNERTGDEPCCARHDAKGAFDHCKARVKAEGLAGPGKVRVNKAGCLDRCAGAPVAVVYPEGTWYTFVDKSDIDEIVESHLKQGKVVERLLLAPDVGR